MSKRIGCDAPLQSTIGIVRVALCYALFLVWGLCSGATPAEQLAQQAQKAERAGDVVRAYLLYGQAAAADPNNISYLQRLQALRPLASLMNASEVKPIGLSAEKIDPTLFGRISDKEIAEARPALPPSELKIPPGRRDFDFRGDSKSLWEQMAAALHLMVLFDTQYQPTRPLRFELNGADSRVALRSLEAATNSFITTVSDQLIFVANDTVQKRVEFERTAVVTIPFSETETVQELQEIAVSVRGVLDAQRIMVDTQRKLIVIRDRLSKVRLAQKIFEDLMRPRAQVAIEVEILSTDRSSALSYGLSPQTAFPLVSFFSKANILQSIPAGFTTFMGFGGGAGLIGLGVTSAQLFASVAKSNSETLLQSEVVAQDGQPASLHVGERYPIPSNQYIGNTTTGGQVYTPPPTFTFEDLGLLLKITPHINGPDEVSLDLDAEFKLLGSTSVDGIPVIGNTKYESKIRVKTGEWAVLAGLMTSSDARTITGIPGMSLIPLLRSNSVNKDNGETLIVLKPHILILPPTERPTWRAWTGTETRLPTDL